MNLCERHAHNQSTEYEVRQSHLMAGSSYTNHAGSSPSAVSTFQSRAHDVGVSSTIKRVVTAPRSQCPSNILLHGNIQFGAIHAICRTKSNGILELFLVNVYGDDAAAVTGFVREDPLANVPMVPLSDGNNLPRARHFGTLDNGQSHSTQSKHSYGRIRFDLASVQNSTQTSGNATSKETNLFQRGGNINFRARDFCQNSIFGHGRTTHKMVDWFAILVFESNGAIWHDTLSLRGANFRT